MFALERTYDIAELVRHSMHNHSTLSKCARSEMTLEAMIHAAEKGGLKTLAITDHSGPGDDRDVLKDYHEYKTRLKNIDTSVNVLIGAELSAYGIGLFGEAHTIDKTLDFASYSHVHYHLETWEQPEDRSPRGYAEHELMVLNALFETDRADNIAHPLSPIKMNFFNEEQKAAVLSSFTDNELGDILEKGERAQCSWELHTPTILRFPEFSKRFFNIGKEAGVHFCVGTDAHSLYYIAPKEIFAQLADILGSKKNNNLCFK